MAGTSLNAIEALLRQLDSKLTGRADFWKSGGPDQSNPAYRENREEIERIRDKIEVAMRSLKSDLKMCDLTEQIAFRQPREMRWRTNQSVRDRRKELGRVYELAVGILSQLVDFEDRQSLPDYSEILKVCAERLYDSQHDLFEEIQENQGHYANLMRADLLVKNIPSVFIIGVMLAILTIKVIKRK